MRWIRNDDPTYIRENYSYELYREFGVLAPHTNLSSVHIGNDHAGVWVIYEPIDKIFLEKNLPAEALGGDLYKLGWTNEGATFTDFRSYGVEDEDKSQFYVYDLKTNKKTSTHKSLQTLINTLKSSSVTKEKFASLVDMESFIYYCAVSYMIGNPDDLRNNYNNTYIYFRADTGKMLVIPYDMDRGLGVNTWNPTGHGMTEEDPYSKKALGNGDQKNPLFLKTVCQGGMFISEYTEALKAVSACDRLTPERFEQSFNIAKNLLFIF
jgi:spore coat protein CotH